MFRAINLAIAITFIEFAETTLEHLPILNHCALRRSERTNLTLSRPRAKILIRFAGRDSAYRPLNTYLALQLRPVKNKRGKRVLIKLPRLAAAIVCIEHKTVVISLFEQQHPCRRLSFPR